MNDTKKVQTMINIVAEQITIIRNAMSTIQDVKSKFQTANPDVTGTPLDGKVSSVNTAISDLQTETDKSIWTEIIDAYISTHRGQAL